MKTRILALAAALALAVVGSSEPTYIAVSATQTAGSRALPRNTQTVVIVAATGADTCYFRLFTDAETPAAATTSSLPVVADDVQAWQFQPARSNDQAYPGGVKSSESFAADGKRATCYKTLTYICGTGESATWRVYAK